MRFWVAASVLFAIVVVSLGKASEQQKKDDLRAKRQICQGFSSQYSACILQKYDQCAWCNDADYRGPHRCDVKSAMKGCLQIVQ
uniref:PSI_integrin domain-containing protein n=1 Tax=Globodera pallida TaxID=36090 RepID=A0A183C164_GLOPA